MTNIPLVYDFGAQFTPYPAYGTPESAGTADARFSGQNFRREVLIPLLARGQVVIDLTNSMPLPSSFRREAFSALLNDPVAMEAGLTYPVIRQRLKIVSDAAVHTFDIEQIYSDLLAASMTSTVIPGKTATAAHV